MSQVLQVLDIFEICIARFPNFSVRQKWPALVSSNQKSMMVIATIYVEIIYNSYLIVNSRRRLNVS